ncbi:MAG: phytanoyl-CoA dioxygenase family protein [Pirellulaceae bacterium]|nr:phytanoyl-CoA dioxygenase family protein [Pirellulaceae bacterium]
MSLTKDQVGDYRQNGYIVLDSFFDELTIQEVDQVIEQITHDAVTSGNTAGVMELEPQSDGDVPRPRRILEPFQQHECFRRLVTSDKLLDSVASLLGPNLVLHISKLNFKPARVGSVVEWHQDLAYYPHTNDDLVTVLVYFDDATEENGCLRVMPRQHDHYFDHHLQDGRFAGMITEDIEDGRFGSAVPLAAPSGSVIMMHPMTPHSSLPNRSDNSRRTLIVSFRASDAVPLFYNDRVVKAEKTACLVRGKPAKFARFGGPAPMLPQFEDSQDFKSLYTLQDEAKFQGTS